MANIKGTNGNDTITLTTVSAGVTGGPATDGADVILALLGKDRVESGGGNDDVYGDEENPPKAMEARAAEPAASINFAADKLYLGDGDDFGIGDRSDIGNGKGGADLIDGGAGDDSIAGDTGDTLAGGGIGGADRIYGGDGDDELYGDAWRIDGAIGGADKIDGGDGEDYVVGDAGYMLPGARGGKDSILGGNGEDFLVGDAQSFSSGLEEKLARQPSATDDPVRGGDDTIHGDADADTLVGDAVYANAGDIGGKDKLYGDDGDDFLFGDTRVIVQGFIGGNDILNGGAGDDEIWSGGGADVMIGGSGSDRFVYQTGDGKDLIKDFVRGEDGIVLFDDDVAIFNELDGNGDGVLNGLDDGVTAGKSKISIDFGFNNVAGVDVLTIQGIGDLRLTDLVSSELPV